MTTTTVADVDEEVQALQDRAALLRVALAQAEAATVPVDAALAQAQAVYDAAGAELAAAQAPYQRDPYGQWTEPRPGEAERAQEAIRAARSAFDQADDELRAALVARTTAHGRRGELRMALARVEGELEAIEAQRERERREAEYGVSVDVLAAIRRRVLGAG